MLEELPPSRGKAKCRPDHSAYDTPVGRLPPVTTVLGATSAGKERLQQWLKRPDAQSISDAAKARGSWLHGCNEVWIDAHSQGIDPPDFKHFAHGGYWRSMRPWLEKHWRKAVAIEQTVYHPSGWAGTFDALGYADYGDAPDQLSLIDWKSSRLKRDEALVEDYFCQLGAYAQGIEYVHGVRPERALLVIARPTCPPDVWELSGDELSSATERFTKRLQQYYTQPPETDD